MDVRVEAGPLTASSVLVETRVIIDINNDVKIIAPTIARFSLAPVISVGGQSISAINPQVFGKVLQAIA